MPRVILISVALLALALATPAGAQTPTPLRATAASCSQVSLTAVFTGSMPAVRGTRTMAMRFDLQSRRGVDAGWSPLEVPGLGAYKRSSPDQSGFVFTQRVQALAAPGSYRAIVRFRWLGRGGIVLKAAKRTTGTCALLEPRPDLRPGALAATLLDDGRTARYSLAVSNAGRAGAGAFAVDVAGVRTRVSSLRGGTQATVTLDAPRCSPGDLVAIVLDPAGEIQEADETDDAVQRACPLS